MPYAKGDGEQEVRVRALRDELQKLGWIEGGNLTFDERWATDNMDTVRANAASLVNSHPDAIVAIGGRVIPVLLGLTQTVPIVVPGASDPVETSKDTRIQCWARRSAPTARASSPRPRIRRRGCGRLLQAPRTRASSYSIKCENAVCHNSASHDGGVDARGIGFRRWGRD
jgi:hypothetical protein